MQTKSIDRDLDDDEMRTAFLAYRQNGDRRVRDELLEAHDWIATSCARRFMRRGEPDEDLCQVARLALVKAIERYDPDTGYKFSTYAVPTVLGEIKRYFRDATWRVKVPRGARELLAPMKRSIDLLSQQLARFPTVDEIAEHMGVDREWVLQAMEVDGMYRAGTDSGTDDGIGSHREATARHESDAAGWDTRMVVLDAVSDLDERSRKILLWRFYDGLTQAEIGEQLGIGQMQVSRLLRRSLEELRSALESDDRTDELQAFTRADERVNGAA